jgi:hypothetical protein
MAAEVVDMIIDHLHDHKHDLQSCALVAHAWLPASRFHLFRSIELSPKRRTCPRHCDKLYAVIQRSPHLVKMIRELHIYEGSMGKGFEWVNDAPCLALILDSLTHLNALHLRRINWIRQTPKLRGAFRRVLASNPVSKFDFEKCSFPFSSFLSILNTSSTSISLTLVSFGLQTSDLWPEEFKTVEKEEAGLVGLGNKCRFHDIRLAGGGSEIRSWLNDPESGPDLSRLHTLYCEYIPPSRVLLLRLGEHLQHLCLNAAYAPLCVSIPSLSLIVLHSHSL